MTSGVRAAKLPVLPPRIRLEVTVFPRVRTRPSEMALSLKPPAAAAAAAAAGRPRQQDHDPLLCEPPALPAPWTAAQSRRKPRLTEEPRASAQEAEFFPIILLF